MTDALTHNDNQPKRRHRSRHGMGQFVTDLELIEYLGLPEQTGRQALEMLDAQPRSTFPPKQPFWGDRRYLPAVDEWLRKNNGLYLDRPQRRNVHE